MPFNFHYHQQENGDRIYLIGEKKRIIPKLVLDRIREWGAEPYKTIPKYDEKIVQLLLVSVYTAAGFLRTATVDECVCDFINSMYSDIIHICHRILITSTITIILFRYSTHSN